MSVLLTTPPPHAIAAIVLTGAMFYGFVSGRVRVEIISLLTISAIALGLYFYPLPGHGPTDGLKLAFEGFGHYALVTICALMVLGRGLVTTGALEPCRGCWSAFGGATSRSAWPSPYCSPSA